MIKKATIEVLLLPGIMAGIEAEKYDLSDIEVYRDEYYMGVFLRVRNNHGRAKSIQIIYGSTTPSYPFDVSFNHIRSKMRRFLKPAYRHFDWDYEPEWKKRKALLFKKFY